MAKKGSDCQTLKIEITIPYRVQGKPTAPTISVKNLCPTPSIPFFPKNSEVESRMNLNF